MKRDDYCKEIIEAVRKAAVDRDERTVFRDFCHASALAIEAPVAALCGDRQRHGEIEKTYASIRDAYGKNIEPFPGALASVVEALDATGEDVLGHCYETLNATNKRFGQFFTPTSVSRLMSDITVAREKPEPGKIVTMNDPCCGAGVLLIEAARSFIERGGRQGDLMIYAEDLDMTAADCAYIQLSLLGLPARVTRMDSLSRQGDRPRLTIGYFLHMMPVRLGRQDKDKGNDGQ